MSEELEFAYSNRSHRGPGRLVGLAGRILPGVARVQADVEPFARYWERANLEALASDDPLWVALGDSLTQGIGATVPESGWVGRVAQQLAGAGRRHAVVNLGVSGAIVDDVLTRQLRELDRLDAQLVTVMVGSNDLMRPAGRAELPQRFGQLLERLPRGSVVTTLPNPSRVAARVNREIERAAARRDLGVVELRDPRLASWRGRLAADHFHPNDAGYRAIADVVAENLLRR